MSRTTHRIVLACLACSLSLATYGSAQVYRAVPGPAAALAGLPAGQVMTGFGNEIGKPAAVQTRAAAFLGRDSLAFVIECLEPRMDLLAAKCQKDDDAAIFADDCLEMFVSPGGEAKDYYHFATNALGARYDEKGRGDAAWGGKWTVHPTKGADRWTVEVSLPFATLGARPQRGSVWWFNICRQRQPGGLQLSSWSPTDSDFHDSTRFAAMTFDDASASYLVTHYLDPFDRRVAQSRQRARVRPGVARRFETAISTTEASLQALRSVSATGKPIPSDTFGAYLETGRRGLKTLDDAEADLAAALADVEAARQMAKLVPAGKDLLAYVTVPVTDRRILPSPDPPKTVSREIRIRACRGEFEPASFVVYSPRRPATLEVKVSDLRGSGGAIPASAVDVRSVKCWYQAGGNERFPTNRGMHLLTPELLLRDDDLVRVDTVDKRNLVKLQYPDGTRKWICISSPEPSPEEKDSSVAALPICDAATLQPVTVPARTAKQFWVTVHVPTDTRTGQYRGAIELTSGGRTLETLPVTVEVLPFDLAPNPLESSIYFHWGLALDMQGQGTLGISTRTPAQLKAELIDLRDHGIDNPTVGVHATGSQLPDELRLRQEVGMRNDRLYYLVGYTWALSPDQIKQIIAVAQGFGFTEFYFYGADEAVGDRLKEQRPHWEKVHAAGGKVFVAGTRGQNFPIVGDLQDLLVCYGEPSSEEAANWHSKGHKIFCYANPQGGIEAPETYRRNFGLLLAVNKYDGGMTYIYYSGTPSWNDYAIPPYRQHNFVYPTVDGVIDTIEWEGYREGIDDLRYLGTLRKTISDATAAGGKAAGDARQAQAFVDKMDVTGDLYAVRDTMIRWIIRLRKATGSHPSV